MGILLAALNRLGVGKNRGRGKGKKGRKLSRSRRTRVEALEPRAMLATISGFVFNDLNGDGSMVIAPPPVAGAEPVREPGLPGASDSGLWRVEIKQTVGGATTTLSLPTANDGSYTSPDLAAGTYTVSEVSHPFWAQTGPVDDATHQGSATKSGYIATQRTYLVTLATQDLTELNFGNSFARLVNLTDIGTAPNSGDGGSSDTGIPGPGQVGTWKDQITKDSTPTFTGAAPQASVITISIQTPTGDTVQMPQVVMPGSDPTALGTWTITSPALPDGTNVVTATIKQGTVEEQESLSIFVDTQAPKVQRISVGGGDVYNLDNPVSGARPAIWPASGQVSLDITFQSDVSRENDMDVLYKGIPAVNFVLAEDLSNYHLTLISDPEKPVVEFSGKKFLASVEKAGEARQSTIKLLLNEPLPDGTYKLLIDASAVLGSDGVPQGILSDAGVRLDGNGDGIPGGTFSLTFSITTKAKLGVATATGVELDMNGNYQVDTTARGDAKPTFTQRPGDVVFAGKFAASNSALDGFEHLAAYGRDAAGRYRWIIDTNSDGIADKTVYNPYNTMGWPVAGNFDPADGDPSSGDQLCLFDGKIWWIFKRNTKNGGNAVLDKKITSKISGRPVVGDFNGDGLDEFATYRSQKFYIQFPNKTLSIPYPGTVRSYPVACNVDADSTGAFPIDDLGLWVPDEGGTIGTVSPNGKVSQTRPGDWYFLLSGGLPLDNRGGTAFEVEQYSYGSTIGIPLVGMFSPNLVKSRVSVPGVTVSTVKPAATSSAAKTMVAVPAASSASSATKSATTTKSSAATTVASTAPASTPKTTAAKPTSTNTKATASSPLLPAVMQSTTKKVTTQPSPKAVDSLFAKLFQFK
jgi:hypothetical protein